MFRISFVHVCRIILILPMSVCSAVDVPLYDFSMAGYSQNVDHYLSPQDDRYMKPLISTEYQQTQTQQFYQHYYADDAEGLSPWSEQFVAAVLPQVYAQELSILDQFNNLNKPFNEKHYAENFKEHDEVWWQTIKTNMDLPALIMAKFQPEHRAIAVANTFARALPDIAPDFYHVSLPGQGFPFDNLQDSVIWVGTPLYVLSTSQDKAWSLVLTPDGYFSWIKSLDMAYVSADVMQKWQRAAQRQLVAVTATATPILDHQQHFQCSGYIGTVLPMHGQDEQAWHVFVPVKNRHHRAVIKIGKINKASAAAMPLQATPQNMAKILQQLQNRPYGWGGAFLFNDCSLEMKSIFTPFGVWLPRNSAQQAKLDATENLSVLNMDERLKVLQEKGHPLMTLIFIGGHVMLYLGQHQEAAMTYQNVWGLAPIARDKRYVIGKSVFLPLLASYPDNLDVMSLANKSIFKLIYLDTLPQVKDTPESFVARFM
ncbi:MAG: hypothetical protein CK424_04160 [Legionella sp.]|nr:MAG: hypothetical protein CK424_04160 [Legionella sp.]